MARIAGLARYVAKRLLLSVGVIFGVIVITFIISRVMVPDPARAWAGKTASKATINALAARFHLNDPLYVQFYYYLSDLLHGDWGIDPMSGLPILSQIEQFFPATMELTIYAFILTLAFGTVLGVIAATHRNKLADHVARVVSLSGVASPPFLAALLLQLIFFYYLGVISDSGGQISVLIQQPPHITGLLVLDSIIAGNLPALSNVLQHLILPGFALAFLTLGAMSRLVRASMLEALSSDYVRTAKAKGLERRLVVYKHALKNALAQPLTAMGVYLAYLLGGAVVVENVFSWPGIGRYAAQAALTFDLPAIMGTTIVFVLGVIIANLAADILLGAIDPRITLR